jgi:hypothetical protein
LLAQYVMVVGSQQAGLIVAAVIVGVEAVGAIRGGQALLGPLNVLSLGLVSFAIPEMSRRSLERRDLLTAASGISGALVATTAGWGTVLVLLPVSVGTSLLGDTWVAATGALVGLLLYAAGVSATTGPSAVFRAIDRTSRIFQANLLFAPLLLVLPGAAGLLIGPFAMSWGMAVAAWLVVPVWWVLLSRERRPVGLAK